MAYASPAYRFLLDALDKARSDLKRSGHVSGQELLDGIAALGTETFGPMAAMVFESWGIRDGSDFGEIVFELIEQGVLSRQDNDQIEDFAVPYPYRDYFEEDYFCVPGNES